MAQGDPWEVVTAVRAAMPVAAAKSGALPMWTLEEILAFQPDPANQIWPGGILTAGDAAALVGAPGVGKSRLALQAAVCTILGRHFLGWETRGRGKKWLFLQTENNGERLQHDLQRMTAILSAADRALLNSCLRILKIDAMEFGSICMVADHPDRARIEQALEEFGPDIVVIDPLRDAGRGDPNKDEMMTETCQSIAEVVKRGAPQRTPLIIHHGRTGKAEASKVFGDDSASFARNSKVLYGWLRSQINVAEAGIDYPGVVIVGCGKCSNGRKWEAFAAQLDERTMMYVRLRAEDFDLDEWAGDAGAPVGRAGKSKRKVSPEEVAAVVARHGGRMRGGEKAPEGLTQRLRGEFNLSREDALRAIERSLGETVESVEESDGKAGRQTRIYYLKPNAANAANVPRGTPGTPGTPGTMAQSNVPNVPQ